MNDLIGKATDVQQTLSYGSSKMGRRILRLGLTALVACGVLVWLQPSDFNPLEWAMTYSGLVIGAACALYGFDRWLRPKACALPVLIPSPARTKPASALRGRIFFKTPPASWSRHDAGLMCLAWHAFGATRGANP